VRSGGDPFTYPGRAILDYHGCIEPYVDEMDYLGRRVAAGVRPPHHDQPPHSPLRPPD
jgi:hypothetical protein